VGGPNFDVCGQVGRFGPPLVPNFHSLLGFRGVSGHRDHRLVNWHLESFMNRLESRSAVVGLVGLVFLVGCAAETPSGGAGGAGSFGGPGGVGGGAATSGNGGFGATGGVGATSGNGGFGGVGAIGGAGGTGTAGSGGNDMFMERTCNVDGAQAALLTDPNVAVGNGMRWLYPYEYTVFPRGLAGPLLMWEGGPETQTMLLRIRSQNLDFEACFQGTGRRLQIPQQVWDIAGTWSRGKMDPTTIELVVAGGGQAAKLPPRQITFALANLNSAIYYNTYGSALAQQAGIVGGVVMRVRPKTPQAEVFLTSQPTSIPGSCVGCHAVSADGSRIIAEEHSNLGLTEGTSVSFALTPSTPVRPMAQQTGLRRAGFSALFHDGSIYLTSARTQAGPVGMNHVSGTFGPEQSLLYDANTGAQINAPGLPGNAMMPMFSVDGAMVAYTDSASGRTLSVMDFARMNNNTFSNKRDVYTNNSAYVSWPFFLPNVEIGDSGGDLGFAAHRRIVFAVGTSGDHVTQTVAPWFGLPSRHPSDLWWIDIESNPPMAAPLGRAGGFAGSNNFLPDPDSAHMDYMPTVSPVAAGGYFWMFFSSRRSYGNMFPTMPTEDTGKKIWVAAIDINTPAGSDPSHPAFFLPGQELESGNVRAFAALEPCRADGASCETGIDCCSGFCIDGICGRPPEPRCSEQSEACTTGADCCEGKFLSCIGGFCSVVLE